MYFSGGYGEGRGGGGGIDLDCRPGCENLADVLFCQCDLTFSLCSSVGTVGPHLIAVFNLGWRKTQETPRDSPYTARWSGYCGEYTLDRIVVWYFFFSPPFVRKTSQSALSNLLQWCKSGVCLKAEYLKKIIIIIVGYFKKSFMNCLHVPKAERTSVCSGAPPLRSFTF